MNEILFVILLIYCVGILIAIPVIIQDILEEKKLNDLYEQYGEKIEVDITYSKQYSFKRIDNNGGYYFEFRVSFNDKYGKNHEKYIRTTNKAAKKYMNAKYMEVFCLTELFSEYKSAADYSNKNSQNNK